MCTKRCGGFYVIGKTHRETDLDIGRLFFVLASHCKLSDLKDINSNFAPTYYPLCPSPKAGSSSGVVHCGLVGRKLVYKCSSVFCSAPLEDSRHSMLQPSMTSEVSADMAL